MKRRSPLTQRVVLVTTPSAQVARRLARLALEARLVACANLVPGIESHYWWKEKLARSREWLVIFKTDGSALDALERLVVEHHPYDTPKFLVLRPESGTEKYLAWIRNSVTGVPS